jgi:NitT/TauT family transport system ATP-binding protein
MTVGENVTFGLKLQGVSPGNRRAIAADLLRKVGLSDAAEKRPDQLSGGMRQRAAMARALSLRPEVLLLDEPFAALDVQTRAKMQDFLLDVWRESGASMLFVTHHIEEAVGLADRVVVFTARPGRIKSVVPIDLPRPRDPRAQEFRDLSDQLTDLLRDEVDRAFAEQERVS